MNKIITEDYVSYEIALLLKEKGFEGDVNGYYHIWDNGHRVCTVQEFSHSEAPHLYIPSPTHQMVMKWLREVHNIFIQVELYSKLNDYCFEVFKNTHRMIVEKDEVYNSYEEACEASIKYTLENLI